MSTLVVRTQQLITACNSSSHSAAHKIASRKLKLLQSGLASLSDDVHSITEKTTDICLLQQYQEQAGDIKKELGDLRNSTLSLDPEESEDLQALLPTLKKNLFDCFLQIKKLLHSSNQSHDHSDTAPPTSKGVKLPKIDVPTFDGNILNWRTFWEQFSVSIHNQSNLTDAEKLVYLRHSLKDGSAKHVIEGLSRSGDYYAEAVECLQSRYDRPRLIHQIHVRMILETPSLKNGTGQELCRLHDTVQQHLRALRAMDYEPSGPFITSTLELKLDTNTMFEWQKHSQDSTEVPHFQKLLEFINLRAQASESSVSDSKRPSTQPVKKTHSASRPVASFAASVTEPTANCVLCKTEKHPLYACSRFKSLSHDKMVSTLKTNNLCMNCLRPGHFIKNCKSQHHCRKCQKPHHTLLHMEPRTESPNPPPSESSVQSVTSNAATGLISNSLLMTCRVLIDAPDGSSIEARAILDSASSVSFITERLVQTLCLHRSHQNARISGVAGLTHKSPLQSIANFKISSVYSPTKKIDVAAIVVPRVTCDLPLQPTPFNSRWKHLDDITLSDPDFGHPGRVDMLLGIDIFVEALMHGRRAGPLGTPMAFETLFGWVLAGKTNTHPQDCHIASHHASLISGDDLLRKFWEIEENPKNNSPLSPEERSVVNHFRDNHTRTENGRFVVPLPKKPETKPLGESRSQAVRRFLALERSLHSRNQFEDFNAVMQEYLEMDHAEVVPTADLQMPPQEVFYLPMHAVRKESSSTTKLRAVFDASAKSTSGISLNDTLLVGPTIHPPLTDVLLRFRFHRVALTTDVSKMYRAIKLIKPDRDLHRFIWRQTPGEPLKDYRITRLTFGVSASSFAENMSVKQNAIDFALEYPQAAKVVEESFYVDDGLTGADTVTDAIKLQIQLQDLFSKRGFLLRKWNSSEPKVLQHISPDLQDSRVTHLIADPGEYTKTLGVEWNAHFDHFRLTVSQLPPLENITKRALVSDIAKTFDVLGWFSPTIIKAKILLQQTWEQKIDWDDQVPPAIFDSWIRWRSELDSLSTKHIPRCYYRKDSHLVSIELHGFCDASENAYAGVIYFRMVDSTGNVQTSLVTSKTKVAPIKRLTIPRLELCGAHLLAQLLHHVKKVFDLPFSNVYAWTDSTIVLGWLVGNPRRFKTYVGNRISYIMDLIPPDRWNHVNGCENPADCASRGLYPSELLDHDLWWNGPSWLKLTRSLWPKTADPPPAIPTDEEKEVSLHTVVRPRTPLLSMNDYSSFTRLKRITAWILRFIHNCQTPEDRRSHSNLSPQELSNAENYWISISQQDNFPKEIVALHKECVLNNSSPLLPLHPIMDSSGVLRVGGRDQNSKLQFSQQHPVILHGRHPLTKLLIRSEHVHLLHAGPTLLIASLGRRYHILGCRKIVRSITRGCITCRRTSAKPQTQMLGQLPIERVTPDLVFNKVGVDYAGPIYLKYGFVRKPTIIKAYICVFVSLSVKAVHLELVSDLTTDAFIASLRRFTARRGKPSLIWSDHGTNFVGAAQELKELVDFLKDQKTQGSLSEFCSTHNIHWKFIPEHAPHFGGLWEAAVKSMKTHLRRVLSNTKLTFEEFSTVITQVEACLNSRPLAPLPVDDDGIEVLTPGHFLIGRPLESLPDPAFSYRSFSLLRRWHLCQALVRHFWHRWSTEYIIALRRYTKWHHPSKNISVGDIVVLQENNLVPTRWPLARVIEVHPGKDGLVRVVTVKTSNGSYKRPITKVALLLPTED